MKQASGATRWYIPDMYLPAPHNRAVPSHETINFMNVGTGDANVRMTAIFEDDRPPIVMETVVKSMRSLHFRTDRTQQTVGVAIPLEVPYSLIVESDAEVIVEYTRLTWVDGEAVAFGVMAYCE